MYIFLIILHLFVCIGLIAVVLVQSGKGGGLSGGAFGGSAQTVFGGRGATDFITRATMILGGLFFTTSLVLALMSSGIGRASHSLIQDEARRAGQATAPPPAPGQRAPGTAAPTQGVPLGGTRPAPVSPAVVTPSPATAKPAPAPNGGK